MALIEIDGLPINSTVDLSMANCECHNQRVFSMALCIPVPPEAVALANFLLHFEQH